MDINNYCTGFQHLGLPTADMDKTLEFYEKLGFSVLPDSNESRHDIIQAVTLKSPEAVISFCKGIQAAACFRMSSAGSAGILLHPGT